MKGAQNMRVAAELNFEVEATESMDRVVEGVKEALDKIRTVGDDKQLTLKVYLDVDMETA